MTDLLDALGAAQEGSRELDRQVWLGLGNRIDKIREYGQHEHERWVDGEGVRWAVALTNFSTSIDCALQLVPEGWIWNVASSGCAWVMPPGDLDGQLVIGGIESPAIALCIAALKARAAVCARAAHDTNMPS